jgi:hypothetical protein
MPDYYTKEETRAMLSPRARKLFDAGINNWLEPKPSMAGQNGTQLTPNPQQEEECRQLKAAIAVGLRLNDNPFVLKAYIRLHEIEDGY